MYVYLTARPKILIERDVSVSCNPPPPFTYMYTFFFPLSLDHFGDHLRLGYPECMEVVSQGVSFVTYGNMHGLWPFKLLLIARHIVFGP